jgi:hypothetical protein
MGGGFYNSSTYDSLRKSYSKKSTDDIFTSNKTKKVDSDMDPTNLNVRESRDSADHPHSLAIMIALDETGSMGDIPNIIAREKMGKLMGTLVDNGVGDAHVMFLGIGDHEMDRYPLQVGQFEAETTLLDKWLTSIYLEGGGGGNGAESYLLAYLVAGRHTSIDCFEKRGQKGFLFTIGDERSLNNVPADYLTNVLGYKEASNVSIDQLLQEAQRMYHVFHIHIEEGSYNSSTPSGKDVIDFWKSKLGERVLILDDYDKLCEVIATIVATVSGYDMEKVIGTFDSATARLVKNTISGSLPSVRNTDNKGVITL